MRVCSKCHIEKNESEFYKNRGSCKICVNAVKHKYRESNRERIKIMSENWNNRNRQRVIEYMKKYATTHRERLKAYRKAYFSNLIIKDRNKNYQNKIKELLLDPYVKGILISKRGFSKEILISNPELIELERTIIKIKRELWRTKK